MDLQHLTPDEPGSLLDQSNIDVERLTTLICEFMSRAELRGAEVPAYADTWNMIKALAAGELRLLDAAQVHQVHALETQLQALSARHNQLLDAARNSSKVRAAVAAYHREQVKPPPPQTESAA